VFPFIDIFTCSPINKHYQKPATFHPITVHPNLLAIFVVVYSKISSKHITTKNLSIIYCLFNVAVNTSKYVVAEGKMFEITVNGMEGRGRGLFVVLYWHFVGGWAIKTTKVSSMEVSCYRQEPRISKRPLE
jgi:hypothetical protein